MSQPTRLVAFSAGLIAATSLASGAMANDARSISLGGSIVANAKGAHGALSNPASLMSEKRDGKRWHLTLGSSIEVRDDAGVIDVATDDDNEDIINDIEREIDDLDISTIQCNPLTGQADDVCLDGLGGLGELADQLLDIIDTVDDENISLQGEAGLSLAFTNVAIPFGLHFQARATGRGKATASSEDRDYFDTYLTTLEDGQLTLGEITDAAQFTLDQTDTTLDIDRPEDTLTSTGEGGGMVRLTFGASLATSIQALGLAFDVGVTPKLSQLIASGIDTPLRDAFDDDVDFGDRFSDSEATESSFTFDVGGAVSLAAFPVRLGAVLRNVVPEKVETEDGITFETTPQLVVGATLNQLIYTLNLDIALNEADVDSFATQTIALGGEIDAGPIELRAGINHDMARETDPTALSLGVGLGPVELALRGFDVDNMQASVQLGLSF